MTQLLRALGLCALFFVVLSISVNKQPIFDHVYSVTSHVSIPAQNLAMGLFDKAADSTTAYTKRLFDNSVPKVRDAVKAKASAPSRSAATSRMKVDNPPEEIIMVEEKEELDQLIKTHQ